MKKLIGLLGAISLASMGFMACTTTTESGTLTDGGTTKTDGSTSTSDGSTSTSDGSTSTGDSGSCTLVMNITDDAACNTCAQNNCCAAVNACAGDAECIAINDCVNECFGSDAGDAGDPNTCIDACIDAHPTGEDKFIDANGCVAEKCEAQCQ